MDRLFCAEIAVLLVACSCGESSVELDPSNGLSQRGQCQSPASLKPLTWAKQGTRLQGLVGQSFTVLAARFGCQYVSGLNLAGTRLSGIFEGKALSGADFQGAVLRIEDSGGTVAEIAATNVQNDSTDPSGETLLYTLFTLQGDGTTLQNICTAASDGNQEAIPLSGHWDATGAVIRDGSISFNCTSGVIAKCVRWGYRPWQSDAGQSLADYHQACTRMARADYCGDGQTHTQDGTSIDMYDKLGMLTPSLIPPGVFEATWTTDGAYCISHDRWISLQSLLSPTCQGKFYIWVQPSPVNALDICFTNRTGSSPSSALLSDRTGVNLGL